MALAPVRAAAVLVHDRLDRAEVGLELHPAVHGGRRCRRVARPWAVERRASSGAATRSSIGNATGSRRRSISASTRSQRLGAVLARDRVLHLREAHEPRVRVDAVARVEVLGAAQQPARARGSATGSAAAAPGRRGRTRRARRSRAPRPATAARGRARPGSRSVRSEVSVSARRVYGNDEDLEVVARRRPARRAGRARRRAAAARPRGGCVKAGTQRSVTCGDRRRGRRALTRAARSSSPPRPRPARRRRSRSASPPPARRGSRSGAGAVGAGRERARPASAASTSPWFSIARPRAASSSPSSWSVMPASHGHVAGPSTPARGPCAAGRPAPRRCTAMSVNEWPEPTDPHPPRARHERGRAPPRTGASDPLGCAELLPRPVASRSRAPGSTWAGLGRPSVAFAAASSASRSISACPVRLGVEVGVSRRYASASSAAMQPVPAAVTAWR